MSALILSISISNGNTYATDNTSDDTTTITIRSSCSMTATVTAEHVATMNGGTYSGNGDYPNGIGSTTIQTFCNDRNGYAIYAVGYTNDEEGNTVLKGTNGLDSSHDIVTGTATSGTSGNDVSNWAMKVSAVSGTYAPTITNGFGTFSAVPSTYTEVAQFNSATDSASGTNIGSTINTTYAAYISNTQPAGTYTGQVKYVLVHPDYTNKPTPYIMQDIAEWENELLPEVQVTAVDNRDNTEYTVAKLKDGNIWLLDNLALDPATLINPLTTANTNMDPEVSFTLPASGISNFDEGGSSFLLPAINTNSKNTEVELAMEQSGAGKVGVYYNYCAASAGTICRTSNSSDAEYDICPRGWRIPTGGKDGEYWILRKQYSSMATYTIAINALLSGYFYDESMYGQDEYGGFWSSTRATNVSMRQLFVQTTDVSPGNSRSRRYGMSVRCIHTTAPATPTLQSITTAQLNTLMPNVGDTAKLKDERDNKTYTIGKLADDNYWFLENLALDPATLAYPLTADNTNMDPNTPFTLPASVSESFESYEVARINTDSKNTEVNFAIGQTGTGKVGVYYNYCAASAGTYCMNNTSGSGNAQYDVCPKGWRMPTGGVGGEYQVLRNLYSSDGDYALALELPLSGFYYSIAAAANHNVGGGFWSSTYSDAQDMYRLGVSTTVVNTLDTERARTYGRSVRCIKQ